MLIMTAPSKGRERRRMPATSTGSRTAGQHHCEETTDIALVLTDDLGGILGLSC